MRLLWVYDFDTSFWAKRIQLIQSSTPGKQYDGLDYRMWEETWRKYILKAGFPSYCRYVGQPGYFLASPKNIISCFKEEKVLQALALVVAWGRMVRTKNMIYSRSLEEIEETLLDCIKYIKTEENTKSAWHLLNKKFNWSPVITSKCLHFLTRSLGYEENPPVPIDNKVILEKVWLEFENRIRSHSSSDTVPLPGRWRSIGSSWSTYNRYMTAINCWSEIKGWTTTEVENTLFIEYRELEQENR